jgi:protein-S-isoprenylcysteine O-methyltransferase Ste14
MTPTEMVGTPGVRSWKGERGEWYVVVQAVLLLLILFGPATAAWLPEWPAGTFRVSSFLGTVLLIGGFVWMIAGAVQLAMARSLSALPRPRDAATPVDTGAFALVRHPMYCGGIWAVVGWGLANQRMLVLGYAVVLAVFFDVKASREERSLGEKFPGYADYKRRVRKLIPFVY